MRRIDYLALLTLALVIFGFGTTAFAGGAYLPKDLVITPPDNSLPQELKDLSGIWRGEWKNSASGPSVSMDAILVVKRIEPDKIYILYSWGDCGRWGITADQYEKEVPITNGVFGWDKLEFTHIPSKTAIEGKLFGRSVSLVTMKKQP